MADLSGLGAFAGGMARGIPVGQEMVARQEAIRAAQDQRASREAGQAVQQSLAGYDPQAAIPVQQDPMTQPLMDDGQTVPVTTPYQRLDSIRASAMSIPDAAIREEKLKQVNELAMRGATHHAIIAQQNLKKFNAGVGSANDVVQSLNNAFKFVDSKAPDNMFTLVPGEGGKPASIKDWKGDTVDDSYMYSIAVAAGTNPVLGAEYMRKITAEKAAENRAEKLAESTVTYQGKAGAAVERNAATMESKGVVGDVIELLKGMAIAGTGGGVGGGFNDAAIASQNKQVDDAVNDYSASTDHEGAFTSDQTPLVKSLSQEIYRVARGTNQPVTASDAALVGAYLNFQSTMGMLPADQQEKIDTGKFKLYTQPLMGADGNVVAYDTWVGTKPDDQGQYKRVTGHPIRLPAYVVDRLMVDNEAKTAAAAAKVKKEVEDARSKASRDRVIEATKEGMVESKKSGIPQL